MSATNFMEKKYQALFAGIVRQKGDEVKSKSGQFVSGTYTDQHLDHKWRPVSLVGHTILQSDLMIAEFRRPI